jgi:DNA polymerase-3 subunit epsilon
MLDQVWRDLRLAVVDVETTGLEAAKERVIEVGIVTFERGAVVERYQQLINPGKPIPQEIVDLTGIKDEDVADAPPFDAVAAAVHERLSAGVVVAYNLPFDKGFIEAELVRAGLSWPEVHELDPLVFVRQLHRDQGSKKLGDTAARLGIPLDNAHRAADDAEVAGRVLLALAGNLPQRLGEAIQLEAQWRAVQDLERARWRRNRGQEGLLSSAPTETAPEDEGGVMELGPAYIWGEETDPMRFLFSALPDVGTRR